MPDFSVGDGRKFGGSVKNPTLMQLRDRRFSYRSVQRRSRTDGISCRHAVAIGAFCTRQINPNSLKLHKKDRMLPVLLLRFIFIDQPKGEILWTSILDGILLARSRLWLPS